MNSKTIISIVLFLIDSALAIWIIFGALFAYGLTAGYREEFPWMLFIPFVFVPLLIPPALIFLMLIRRSNRLAERLFWLLSIGFPVFVILAFILSAFLRSTPPSY